MRAQSGTKYKWRCCRTGEGLPLAGTATGGWWEQTLGGKTANQLPAVDLEWCEKKTLKAYSQIQSPLPWKRKKGRWLPMQGAASSQ